MVFHDGGISLERSSMLIVESHKDSLSEDNGLS